MTHDDIRARVQPMKAAQWQAEPGYIQPMLAQAATDLETLLAENERLRGAVEEQTKDHDQFCICPGCQAALAWRTTKDTGQARPAPSRLRK